jgi:HlyD family secretion protein
MWAAAIAAVAVGLLAWIALRPEAVPVEVAAAARGPLTVTVDEQGETRVHDRFSVTAPVAGKVLRIELHEGDPVRSGQVVARIVPAPLGPREREAQLARVASFEALAREAGQRLRHAEEDAVQARREDERLAALAASGLVARQAAEQAHNAAVTAANDAESARQRARSAAADVRVARAGLLDDSGSGRRSATDPVLVRSPIDGRVLAIPEASERSVEPGTLLLVIGDPRQLEVVAEMLTTDAVRVTRGMPARIDGWGGEEPLAASVRDVEPHGFTKVSALGVEEKRTRVILDLPQIPASLGDGYRVTVRIVVADIASAVKIPVGALSRCDEAWCTFVVERGRAASRRLELGPANQEEAVVTRGLAAGEIVVRHPPNELRDGARVVIRGR